MGYSNNSVMSTQHAQHMLLLLVLVVKSNKFQILLSYTLLLKLPVLMRSSRGEMKRNKRNEAETAVYPAGLLKFIGGTFYRQTNSTVRQRY